MAATLAGYGAAAAAGVGGLGLGLFQYNRGNYMMDQKLHYARYTAAATLSIAQTSMYREDIADLTELTADRMHQYMHIADMALTILTALYCPGRLGLHTPPPPGWLMGLEFVCIAGAYLWMGMTMWLAMHASMRAQTAATHMLTRYVRLPVPAQWMLDKARKYLSSYEEQPFRDVLRLPFLMRHRASNQQAPLNDDMNVDAAAKDRTRHGYDLPAWYSKEKSIDNGYAVESMMTSGGAPVPEHFDVYRELQNEWWPYDAYARISIFLAFLHLTHAWTYLQIGHHLQETRSVFAAFCVVLPVSVLQQCILTLDLVPNRMEILQVKRLGPFAQFFAYFAAILEYQRFYSSSGARVANALVFIAYLIHIVFTATLLVLASPNSTRPPEPVEKYGNAWWPKTWHLPSAFQHAVLIVAPPTRMDDDLHDLVGEMRDLSSGNKGLGLKVDTTNKRPKIHNESGQQGESPAWVNVKIGLIAMIIAWVWLTVGYAVEVANSGTTHPSLLNAPGMPNNLRDPRYRKAKPGALEPVEVGTGGWFHGPMGFYHEEEEHQAEHQEEHQEGAHHRRLNSLLIPDDISLSLLTPGDRHALAAQVRGIIPYLYQIAAGQGAGDWRNSDNAAVMPLVFQPSDAAGPIPVSVQWPAFFEPRLITCNPISRTENSKDVLLLSHHARGAIATVTGTADAGKLKSQIKSFSLEGTTPYGTLVAASWDETGLLVTTATGVNMECPGRGPIGSRWHCSPLNDAKLPISFGEEPFTGAVAITRVTNKANSVKSPAFRAAVIFPGDTSVTLFSHSGKKDAPWLPAGETHLPVPITSASFATEDTLLLTSTDGGVVQMEMSDGSMAATTAPVKGYEKHVWQATCGQPNGDVVRLALNLSGALASEPTLLFG